MFDQNDQNAQAAAAQPAAGSQNTTVPDIADPNLTAPAGPAPTADATSAPAPLAQGVPDLTSAPAPAADATDSNAAFVSSPTPPSDASALPTLDPTADTSSTSTTDDAVIEPASAPAPEEITPTVDSGSLSPSSDFSASPSTPSTGSGGDDLLSIKKDALQNLTPLLDHLDQAPEDKFRTTMMLIQASDDKSLIQAAYAAAQQIKDEKEKAQALLDIVNEINYFTQAAEDKAEDK